MDQISNNKSKETTLRPHKLQLDQRNYTLTTKIITGPQKLYSDHGNFNWITSTQIGPREIYLDHTNHNRSKTKPGQKKLHQDR